MDKLANKNLVKGNTKNLAYSIAIILCFILSAPLIIFNKIVTLNKTLSYQKSSFDLKESTKYKIKSLLNSPSKYLAVSKYGISLGHTDQADIYFNTIDIEKEIANSSAFVLGNSRSQFGLTNEIFEQIHKSGMKLYHLGNGCNESIEFGLNIISKYHAKPKILIINADYGFTDPPGICTNDIINHPQDIYNKYLTSREKNRLIVSLVIDQISVLDFLYRNLLLDISKPKSGYNYFDTLSDASFKLLHPNVAWFPIEFRDIGNGRWERLLEQAFMSKQSRQNFSKIIGSDSCSLSIQETTEITNKLQNIKTKYPEVRIVFIYVPNGTPVKLPTQSSYCSKRLRLMKQMNQFQDVYFFDPPNDSSYYTFDGSHLDFKSAQLYTRQLSEWMQKNKVLLR